MTNWLRTKRAIYVVLLCAALIASGYAIYNQVSSDSKAASLASQVAQICHDTPELAKSQNLNCAQAQDVKDSNAPVLVQGPPGKDGRNGEDGADGQDGQSITGPPGTPGRDGDRGMNGNPGIDGQTVTGPPGPEGPQGAKGDKGDKGDQGDRGADGQPGEDAPKITGIDTNHDPANCKLIVSMSDGNDYSTSIGASNCVLE